MNEIRRTRLLGLGLVGVAVAAALLFLTTMLGGRPATIDEPSSEASATVSPSASLEQTVGATQAPSSVPSPIMTATPGDQPVVTGRPVPTVPNLPSPSIELPVP